MTDTERVIHEAQSHLGAAISQSLPTDDQIIMDHVRAAYELLRYELEGSMKVEYDSNNSGGHWWLSDDDWRSLEAAGWEVRWHANRNEEWFTPDSDGRWLGALAGSATKDFPSLGDAIREFERLTSKDASDEGCNCCGPPHSFSVLDEDNHEYASGSDCLSYLYREVPASLREACEKLKK